jgi:hypothetical protein
MTRRMTVYLGTFSSEPFAEGLRSLLSDSGEFVVVPTDDPLTTSAAAGAEPSMVVLEGRDPTACQRYLDIAAIRMVILVDPGAARAFVGVDNPGWEELSGVVRALAGEAHTGRFGGDQHRVRVIGPEHMSPGEELNGGADSVALEPLTRWVELGLALHLTRRGGDGRPGVAGWSVAPHEAFDMLGLDQLGSNAEEDLADRLAAAEDDLFGSGLRLPRAIDDIRVGFSLSGLDLRLFCLLLAPEIDGRYATAMGVLQDDLTRRRPGLTLLAELLSGSGMTTWDLRRALQGRDSLVAKGLVRPTAVEDLAVDVGYEPSAAVVAHLLTRAPDRAATVIGAQWRSSPADSEPLLSPEESELAQLLVLATAGGDRLERWFGRLSARIGLRLLIGDLGGVEPGTDRTAAASEWVVLSQLLDSAVLLLGTEGFRENERRRVADLVRRRVCSGGLVAVDGELGDGTGSPRTRLVMRTPIVSATQRSLWWTEAAERVGLPLDVAGADRLAATVAVDAGDVEHVVTMAHSLVAGGAPGSPVELVQRSARNFLPSGLPAGVRRVEPVYGWDDIVVGEENLQLLKAVPQHVLQAGRVLEEWGFAARVPHGRGVAALFSGPSGTGKTMAAQIIARDLGVDLLQVDLSKTVSKYIGETEKNLDQIFEAAERTGAVLLFDEADAVFGRRTEIKDAHDRHANVEVAYLLQRMELFGGLTILTTNFKQNIDNAFLRRLRFVVDFVLPNAAERAMIWHRAFPEGAPLDIGVDVVSVASRLPLSGGSIQNIALHSAYLAAPHGGPIGVEEVLAAMRRELVKTGMRSAERSLDDLVRVPVGAAGHVCRGPS